MGGGLIQLIATGSQDKFLISNNELTFFKKTYKRYGNFSSEEIKIPFDGNISFGKEIICILPKNFGDLISKMVIQIDLKANTDKTWGYVKKLGFAIIDYVSVYIDGSEIDRHEGDWLNIYHEIANKDGFNDNFNSMIGNISSLTNIDVDHEKYTLNIPLIFWFCKNFDTTLPISCLKERSVVIKLKLKTALDCINYSGTSEPTNLPVIDNVNLVTTYILLDLYERSKFILNSHEYIFDKVQINDFKITKYNDDYELVFGNPCKSLFWISNQEKYNQRKSYLTWAFDNDWNTAKDKFAKLIWLATRNNLSSDGTTITYNPTTFFPGDIPSLVSGGNSTLESLSSKVDAYILFYNSSGVANAVTSNVVLISNELTFEDMSITISELESDGSSTTGQTAFFNIHKVNVIDYFNYGNFVNSSDNPLVNSSLKLNGHNRFNSKGSYFNYNQPLENFNNIPCDGINVYTFSVNPLKNQPSGTCNFSEIRSAIFNVIIGKKGYDDSGTYFTNNFISGNLKVYANTYNLLKISETMCGAAYKSTEY